MKAALLGIEHPHSLAHLRTLQVLPEIDSILLWDENASALAEARRAQGEKVEATFTDLGSLLAQDDLFFVIAALRNDLGPEIFIRVLEAGKHLMAEKPVGKTAADTARVIEVAARRGITLGVCYQNRHNPLIVQAREFVAQGLLGPLISVEVRMLTTQVQFRNPQHWLFNKALSGGGILSWLGCHYIDMIHFVTHDEIASVAAEVATRNGEDIDVEDIAALSLRLKSGAIGSLHAGYTLALSGGGYHNATGYDTYFGVNGQLGRMYWSSSGKAGHLSVETTHPDWSGAPRREFDFALAESPAYGGVYGETFIRDFIRAAKGEGTVPASGYDALRVAQVIDAAYESDQIGRRVMVAAQS
jgi:predicted dehydrogenase